MRLGLLVIIEQVIETLLRTIRGRAQIENAAGIGGRRRRRLAMANGLRDRGFGGGGGNGSTAHSAEAVIVWVFIAAIGATHI
jgi:hypothetical protein